MLLVAAGALAGCTEGPPPEPQTLVDQAADALLFADGFAFRVDREGDLRDIGGWLIRSASGEYEAPSDEAAELDRCFGVSSEGHCLCHGPFHTPANPPPLKPPEARTHELARRLERIAQRKAATYRCDIAIGLASRSGEEVTVAADSGGAPMEPSKRFAWGSVTKLLTGTAILQQVPHTAAQGRKRRN